MFETTHRSAVTVAENHTPSRRSDNRLTVNVAERFICALTELESARDIELMLALFTDDCEVGNIVMSGRFRGIEGARRFWTHYRRAFKDVCSIFQNEIYTGSEAKLEWTSEGKTKNGRKIRYEGVSILETKDEKITHFYAYFDRKKLGRQIAGQSKGNGARAGTKALTGR